MLTANRTLTGEEARKLIDDILNQTSEDFLLHFCWKEAESKPGEIKQHLSNHGTWDTNEIIATGKVRNQQIEEVVMKSMDGEGKEESEQ